MAEEPGYWEAQSPKVGKELAKDLQDLSINTQEVSSCTSDQTVTSLPARGDDHGEPLSEQ